MPENQPTKEGQNLIIKNLSSIFMTLVGLCLAGLFAWANKVSSDNNENHVVIQSLKDEITRLEAKIEGSNRGINNHITEIESDVDDLKVDAEKVHDDLKMRTTRVEDWEKFWEQYHPTRK